MRQADELAAFHDHVPVRGGHALGDGNELGFFVPDALFRNGFED